MKRHGFLTPKDYCICINSYQVYIVSNVLADQESKFDHYFDYIKHGCPSLSRLFL